MKSVFAGNDALPGDRGLNSSCGSPVPALYTISGIKQVNDSISPSLDDSIKKFYKCPFLFLFLSGSFPILPIFYTFRRFCKNESFTGISKLQCMIFYIH
jgi:hypothetical protein